MRGGWKKTGRERESGKGGNSGLDITLLPILLSQIPPLPFSSPFPGTFVVFVFLDFSNRLFLLRCYTKNVDVIRLNLKNEASNSNVHM